VLQVISSSPGDLYPVFQEILEKAVKLFDAAEGGLHTFDGELFHLVALVGAPVGRCRAPQAARPDPAQAWQAIRTDCAWRAGGSGRRRP